METDGDNDISTVDDSKQGKNRKTTNILDKYLIVAPETNYLERTVNVQVIKGG